MNHYQAPHVIHFLPGCADNIEEWRKMNPEFVCLKWDIETLQKILEHTPFLKPDIDIFKHPTVYACIVAYHYGGIVLSTPESCSKSIRVLLEKSPQAMLTTFRVNNEPLDDEIEIDPSIIISTPKVAAFRSLFEFFQKAMSENRGTRALFTQFVRQSINLSTENAIVCLSAETKQELTRGVTKQKKTFQISSPQKTFAALGSDSGFTSEIKDCLQDYGLYKEAKNEKIGVVIVDHDSFDPNDPVTIALEIVTAFQKLELAPAASILVAHCEKEKTGLDLLLQPQLTLMGATLIEKNGFAHWRLP